jgi:hypothetical protein
MKKPLFLALVMISLLYTAKAWSLPDCPWYYFSFTYFYNNCQASITYDDGRKYVGEWRGGKRHGQGTVIWADGGGTLNTLVNGGMASQMDKAPLPRRMEENTLANGLL